MESTTEAGSRKRRRLSLDGKHQTDSIGAPKSLIGSVSPPPLRRAQNTQIQLPKVMKSPFQLTWIRDLPESSNQDAVTLKDILGDPLIAECWEFNYLHNLDFLMDAFDSDIRNLVKVHVIHGFWKSEDPLRLKLKTQASKYPNITLHSAYMPEIFGTHHSKVLGVPHEVMPPSLILNLNHRCSF